MANKVYINPLNGGADYNTDDLLFQPGMVRKAHNMEADITGGFKRIEGWTRYIPYGGAVYPADYQPPKHASAVTGSTVTIAAFSYYAVFNRGDEDYAGTSPATSKHQISLLDSPGQHSGAASGYSNITVYDNTISSATVDDVYSRIAFYDNYSLSGYQYSLPLSAERQMVALTERGDLLWWVDQLRVQQYNDAAMPADWANVGPRATAFQCAADRVWVGTLEGRVWFSEIGTPWAWDAVATAGEFFVDGQVTNIIELTDSSVFISTLESLYIMYNAKGAASGFELKQVSNKTGAYPRSAQRIGNDVWFHSAKGISSLAVTEKFGNFLGAELADKIRPIDSLTLGHYATSGMSTISVMDSQYIYFNKSDTTTYLGLTSGSAEEDPNWTTADPIEVGGFTDGTGHDENDFSTTISFFARVRYGDHEGYWFIGEDGVPYMWRHGTSQNGDAYTSYMTTQYDHFGAPYIDKTYRKMMITGKSEDSSVTLDFATSFDNGINGIPNDSQASAATQGANWSADAWGDFIWGSGEFSVAETYLNGQGQNISVTIAANSDTINSYTVKSLAFVYENRRVDH